MAEAADRDPHGGQLVTEPRPPAAHRPTAGEFAELLAFGLIGLALRFWSLRDQIFSDDEWHALRSAVGLSYWKLYTSFAGAGSPSLALLYKLLHDTVGLTELRMRLPMLCAGAAMPLVFPLLVAPYVDRSARRVFAALLAISPLLVYYSRYARPYSISLFCGFVGLVAFLRWWDGGGRRWAVAYVTLVTLAIHAHAAFAPTLLAPFAIGLLALGGRAPHSRTRPTLRALLQLALATVVALALAIGPALVLDPGAFVRRLGNPRASAATALYAAEMALGTAWLPAQALLTALLLGGAITLAARSRRLVWAWTGVVLAALVPSLLSTANSIHVPIVFLRYSLWLLPALLLLAAVGAGRLLEPFRLRCGEAGLLAITGSGALMLYAAGPLPSTLRGPNAWTSHAIFTYALRDADPHSYVPQLRPTHLPAFYAQLSVLPADSVTIAEAPWFFEWHNNPLPFYQRAHGQRVKAGMLGTLCRQPGPVIWHPRGARRLQFRNAVDLADPAALRLTPVDYLVLHLDLRHELGAARAPSAAPSGDFQRSIVPGCLPRLIAAFGQPLTQDADIVVWRLRPQSQPQRAPVAAQP